MESLNFVEGTGQGQLGHLIDTFDRNHAPASPCHAGSPEWDQYLSDREQIVSTLESQEACLWNEGDGPGPELETEPAWTDELVAAYYRWSYPSLARREVKEQQKRHAFEIVHRQIDTHRYPPTYEAAQSWKADGYDAEIIAWAIENYEKARPEFGPGPDLDAEVDALIEAQFAPHFPSVAPALSA